MVEFICSWNSSEYILGCPEHSLLGVTQIYREFLQGIEG